MNPNTVDMWLLIIFVALGFMIGGFILLQVSKFSAKHEGKTTDKVESWLDDKIDTSVPESPLAQANHATSATSSASSSSTNVAPTSSDADYILGPDKSGGDRP